MGSKHSRSRATDPAARGRGAEGMGSFWFAIGIVVLSVAMIVTRADFGFEVEFRGEPPAATESTGPDPVPYLPSLYGNPAANVEPQPPTF